MKNIITIALFLFKLSFVLGQDKTFLFVEKYQNENRLKLISDSINKPLLVTKDKIYLIGSDCLTRLFDGTVDDRNEDGKKNERAIDGDTNTRKKGGDIADREKKGKKNKRNKDGSFDNRDYDEDVNERNKDANSDNRNSDGAVSAEPRCSFAKNGKILLYTTQQIDSKKANIFYNHHFYPNKYFKIIKL